MPTPINNIRNFCIIAHIDHGKSTLADRFLELTHTVSEREMKEQILDEMDLERERGITIKLTPVRMEYQPKFQISKSKLQANALWVQKSQIIDNQAYVLNLIDTPGHVDFTYEVSRSLAAVEGAILLVDATQGIQAQTLSNLYLALEQDLVIIPAINKIDLPNADVVRTKQEMASLLGIAENEILEISAKKGIGVEEILERVVKDVPSPAGVCSPAGAGDPPIGVNNDGSVPADRTAASASIRPLASFGQGLGSATRAGGQPVLRALIFDSQFDEYKGVIAHVRIFDGEVEAGDKINFFATGKQSEVLEVGVFKPKLVKTQKIQAGEIGYLVTGLKELESCKVGDTVVGSGQVKSEIKPLPGYKEVKPMVFAGIYSKEGGADFNKLREAMLKLKLTDAALTFEPESSKALGPGFRAGFLGLLHLEVVQERLKREYDLDLIITSPSVAYKIKLKQGREIIVDKPQEFPDPSNYESVKEPWVSVDIVTPEDYLGVLMKFVQSCSGIYKNTEYLFHGSESKNSRVILRYELPLLFLLSDFYDKIKSVSSGFASLNYDFLDYRETEVEKIDILVANEKVDAFTTIVHKKTVYADARQIVKRLKEAIPPQLFEVKIQAVTGFSGVKGGKVSGKITASERISPIRKDVTSKLYGGDVTRKMKLLEKQKKGKKKMKNLGHVEIPAEAYIAVLRR